LVKIPYGLQRKSKVVRQVDHDRGRGLGWPFSLCPRVFRGYRRKEKKLCKVKEGNRETMTTLRTTLWSRRKKKGRISRHARNTGAGSPPFLKAELRKRWGEAAAGWFICWFKKLFSDAKGARDETLKKDLPFELHGGT